MNKKCVVWLLLALLLIAGTAAGCRPAEPGENCAASRSGDGKLEFQICTDKAEYRYGEIVYVRFTATNLSEETMEFDGGSGAAMDICDYWEACWSDGQELTPGQTRLVLAPGTSRTVEWTWPPSQAHLDECLGKRLHRSLPVSFRARLTKRPGFTYGPSVGIKYRPERYESLSPAERLGGKCAGGLRSAGDLAMQICTDKTGDYQYGETIHVRWMITNVSEERVVFDGGDEAAMDIRIAGERWSDGQELTPELTRLVLEPGESHMIEWDWPTPQTDLDALLEELAWEDPIKGDTVALINVHGDYMRRPGDRWTLSVYVPALIEQYPERYPPDE